MKDVDGTKKMKFELSGITANNTRTLTIPDSNSQFAIRNSVPDVMRLEIDPEDYSIFHNIDNKIFMYFTLINQYYV